MTVKKYTELLQIIWIPPTQPFRGIISGALADCNKWGHKTSYMSYVVTRPHEAPTISYRPPQQVEPAKRPTVALEIGLWDLGFWDLGSGAHSGCAIPCFR